MKSWMEIYKKMLERDAPLEETEAFLIETCLAMIERGAPREEIEAAMLVGMRETMIELFEVSKKETLHKLEEIQVRPWKDKLLNARYRHALEKTLKHEITTIDEIRNKMELTRGGKKVIPFPKAP